MVLDKAVSVQDLYVQFDFVTAETKAISQRRLNLEHRARVSLLPWRGQFSPQLVELLLEAYGRPGDVVLDPFVGSGTTLFESGRNGHVAYGVDINPAAVYLARTAELMSLPYHKRMDLLDRAERLLATKLEDVLECKFMGIGKTGDHNSLIPRIQEVIEEVRGERNLETVVANALMQATGANSKTLTPDSVMQGLSCYRRVCQRIPHAEAAVRAIHGDARTLSFPSSSMDMILTSPPYVNVFNYHQNYRKAMELLGWDLLKISRSEIGANRKHRQNRFLTLIEYCLDMLDALKEMHRVLSPRGILVLVIGRTSTILRCQFENGRLLYCLAVGGAGFRPLVRHERVFTNRFGERIVEDVLLLGKDCSLLHRGQEFARDVACHFLGLAVPSAPQDAKAYIINAIENAHEVTPSPVAFAKLGDL
jgi:DNA modification methylase